MKRWLIRLMLVLAGMIAFPHRAPAPLVYTPGEGWTYEPVGGAGKWHRTRASEQLQVAKEAFEKKDYSLALKAARRTVAKWPLSDYAPEAQYLVGRCYEAKGYDEKAFNEYQKVLDKYPKVPNYEEILKRQNEIATRFLNGQWFKLWGYIPVFPSMEKTADMYRKLVKNGPYSDVAAEAQLNIGEAMEKKKLPFSYPDYVEAVKAYETAADHYHDKAKYASEALFKAGLAYQKQAKAAEYDQNATHKAIATFTDFISLYPKDPRVTEAQQIIAELKSEQARGNFEIARFYEKKRQWDGALVYYNEVLIKDPNSSYAAEAKLRIETIKSRHSTQAASN